MNKKYLVLLALFFAPQIAFSEDDIGFGTKAEQEQLTREMRAHDQASWNNLHAKVSAKIESAFKLPRGSLSVRLTDDYGSYVSVYLYTSNDGKVQCAMVPTSPRDFGVSCNGRAMFSIRR